MVGGRSVGVSLSRGEQEGAQAVGQESRQNAWVLVND